MISKLPTQGLPLELRSAYFHRIWGEDESIITVLTSRQEQAIKLYYGLLGSPPHRVNEIQEITGGRNHSITRSLCLQGFAALQRQKKKTVCEQLGITTKEIPVNLRTAYYQAMHSSLDLTEGYGKIPPKALEIFQDYYVRHTSLEDLSVRYHLSPRQVLKLVSHTEDSLVETAHERVADTMFQEWIKITQRYCPKCYSTNVLPIFSGGRRNGVRCYECRKPVSVTPFGMIRLA